MAVLPVLASTCMLRVSQEMGVGVRSLLCIGAHRLWVGLACGNIRVFDLTHKPQLLAHWHAHDAAVISAVQAGTRVYTLGRDGSIRGWSAASPSADDDEARCAAPPAVRLRRTAAQQPCCRSPKDIASSSRAWVVCVYLADAGGLAGLCLGNHEHGSSHKHQESVCLVTIKCRG